MFKLNSIFKIVIVIFLSLVIPSFLAIFKISFDEYIAAQETSVQGASIVKVQKVNNKNSRGPDDQSVLVDFRLPRVGTIQNLSQRPFRFPKAVEVPVSAPVNTSSAYYGPTDPIYDLTDDTGRGSKNFFFTYMGVRGGKVAFHNENEYDLNNVRIELRWEDGVNEYLSVYTTAEIESELYYYEDLDNTAEATIPYNPSKILKGIRIFFMDNSTPPQSFTIKL